MPEPIAATSLLLAAAALLDPPRDAREHLAARIGDAVLHASQDRPWRWLHRCTRHPIGRAALRAAERVALPGLCAHYRWRKRHIGAWAEALVQDGIEQVLVLGAGFDALGAHLAMRHPRLRVLETDRAATMARKRDALARIDVGPPTLQHVDALLDGAQALSRTLSLLDRDLRTLVIAEGLLMYVPRDAVIALFRTLAAHFAQPPILVGTAMQLHDGEPGFVHQGHIVRHWLQRRGEPFRWGIDAAAPAASLAALGLDVEAIADPDASENPDPAPGECVFRARVRFQ